MFRLFVNLHTRVLDIYNICVIFSGLQKDFYKLRKYSPHLLYTLKTIRRAQTSANTQGYNNSLIILITTDRIFIKFLSEIDLEPRMSS